MNKTEYYSLYVADVDKMVLYQKYKTLLEAQQAKLVWKRFNPGSAIIYHETIEEVG